MVAGNDLHVIRCLNFVNATSMSEENAIYKKTRFFMSGCHGNQDILNCPRVPARHPTDSGPGDIIDIETAKKLRSDFIARLTPKRGFRNWTKRLLWM